MPPLQLTQSIHSWWSDSNSLGATIPLHTLAKPLSKFLHHRQVAGILSQLEWPVSEETLDVLSCYLETNEILTSTKLLILGDIDLKARREAFEDSRGMGLGRLRQALLPVLMRLLLSPEKRIVDSACTLLGSKEFLGIPTAASKENVDIFIWYLDAKEISSSTKLLILQHLHVRAEWEIHALNLAEEKPFCALIRLLHSPDKAIGESVCTLLGTLPLSPENLDLLVSHLESAPTSDRSEYRIDEASNSTKKFILKILRIRVGCETLGQKYVPVLLRLLDSRESSSVRAWACTVIGTVSLSEEFLSSLLSSLQTGNIPTSTTLLIMKDLFFRIKWEAQGNEHELALRVLIRLLDSPELPIVGSACSLLGSLADWESINTLIVRLDACKSLISVATQFDAPCSMHTLGRISAFKEGARVIAEATVDALTSRNDAPVIFYRNTLEICVAVSESEIGARALFEAKILDRIPAFDFLQSFPLLLESVFLLLGNMARCTPFRESVRQHDISKKLDWNAIITLPEEWLREAERYALYHLDWNPSAKEVNYPRHRQKLGVI
ncbi:hypothetical protein C8R43DRAFT_1038982 [Mycena crocata]|nr:hypothetical protein C8R43DRAFT_1038982 [Mycena crocata]